jgi:hypothetical protein
VNITKDETIVKQVITEPGNATRYVGFGFLIPKKYDSAGQWMVCFPYWGTCYHFHEGSYIAFGYMIEKMGHDHLGREVNWPDLGEQMKIVAEIIGGTCEEVTDKTGHLTDEWHLRWARQNEKSNG